MSPRIHEIFERFKKSGQLPSPKGVALELLKLTRNDQANIDDLVRLVKSDPALTGRILKFANSSGLGNGRHIASLNQAVILLGLFRIRQLTLMFALLERYRAGVCHEFDYGRYWATSLLTGLAVQEMASLAQCPAEECFTCGLLSGVGRLALATLFPKEFGALLRESPEPAALIHLEKSRFGLDHNELSSDMLLNWGLPELFAEAVQFHENPLEADFAAGSRASALTHVLHFARVIAEALNADHGAQWSSIPNVYQAAAHAGFETKELPALLDRVESKWADWSHELHLSVRPVDDFKSMLASSQDSRTSSHWQIPDLSLAVAPLGILVVGRDAEWRNSLRQELLGLGLNPRTAVNEAEMDEHLRQFHADVLLIDVRDQETVDHLYRLRMTASLFPCHCIGVLQAAAEADMQQLIQAGLDDYVVYPASQSMLLLRLNNAQRVVALQEAVRSQRESAIRSSQEWAETNRRLLHEALCDPLTQLPNRRYGFDRLQQEWDFSTSAEQPLALLMIDIDFFKQINDQHGHETGDEVLRQLAQTLNGQCRKNDVVFRYGGEEFALICPATGLKDAIQIAERIVQGIRVQEFGQKPRPLHLTISIGVSVSTTHIGNPETLLKKADEALYAAKAAGRNRVMATR